MTQPANMSPLTFSESHDPMLAFTSVSAFKMFTARTIPSRPCSRPPLHTDQFE